MSTGQYRRRQEFYRAYSSVNSAGKPCQRPCICDSIQLADTGRKEWIPINKVRITVLKTTFDQALAAEYGANGLTACPMLQEGQVFYADYAKPAGLCDEAWKAIYQYAFALSHGAGETLFYYGDWISKPALPFAAVTTVCDRLSSSWKPPICPQRLITRRYAPHRRTHLRIKEREKLERI